MVGQELLCIFFLQFYQAGIEVRDGFCAGLSINQGVIFNSVTALVLATHVQVEVDVDAVQLQLIDEIVQAVELLRIHGARVVARVVDETAPPCRIGLCARSGSACTRCSRPTCSARPTRTSRCTYAAGTRPVKKLEANTVDAEAGELGGEDLSVVVRRQHIGAVDAPEAKARAVGCFEMSAGDADETTLARGSFQQEAHVGGRGRGGEVVDGEVDERRIRRSFLRGSRCEREKQEEEEGGQSHAHLFITWCARAGSRRMRESATMCRVVELAYREVTRSTNQSD